MVYGRQWEQNRENLSTTGTITEYILPYNYAYPTPLPRALTVTCGSLNTREIISVKISPATGVITEYAIPVQIMAISPTASLPGLTATYGLRWDWNIKSVKSPRTGHNYRISY